MTYITILKLIRIKNIVVVVVVVNLIIDYNNHYIHFEDIIIKTPLVYKHHNFSEYKFVILKEHLKTFFCSIIDQTPSS
jgi:hypothetical protein